MNKPKSLSTWQLIHKSLRHNQPVILFYVLESTGSSPGRQGFLMAVNALGEMAGSIGGGIMEYKFIEMAKEKLTHSPALRSEPELSVLTQYHDKKAVRNQSGMICSGNQTMLLYRVQVDDAPIVQAIITCLEQHKNGLLALAPAGIQFTADQVPEIDYQFTRQSETDWLYQEKIGYKNQLFIIGGGHCALALSQLMSQMDFHIRLFDDRPNLPMFRLNAYAHEITIIEHYSELTRLIPSGRHHYVVVMTVGYRTDELAVRALLEKDFRYFGLLGSKTKIKKLFDGYRTEGVPDEALRGIHAPAGLAINSQTPEEIAVSIAGEIIRVKYSEE